MKKVFIIKMLNKFFFCAVLSFAAINFSGLFSMDVGAEDRFSLINTLQSFLDSTFLSAPCKYKIDSREKVISIDLKVRNFLDPSLIDQIKSDIDSINLQKDGLNNGRLINIINLLLNNIFEIKVFYELLPCAFVPMNIDMFIIFFNVFLVPLIRECIRLKLDKFKVFIDASSFKWMIWNCDVPKDLDIVIVLYQGNGEGREAIDHNTLFKVRQN